jgi:SAM-dependent methyltransferase
MIASRSPRSAERRNVSHILAFLRAQLTVGRVLKTIDLGQFRIYRERYRTADPRPHGYSKYLDIRPWMATALMQCFRLGLHRSRPLQILDIGTGAGYFPYVCSLYGHKVVALDLDTVPMYNEICAFLKVDRRTWRVEKLKNLPNLGMKFDLVTAFMIKFNNHYSPDQWGVDEWKFMLEDLRTNLLEEDGRMLLSFNANLDGTFFDEKLLAYFLSVGGKKYRNRIEIGGPKRDGSPS